MTVAVVLGVFSVFGFFVTEKRNQYAYLLITVLIMSILYLFFVPPAGYDLEREYEFLKYIKGLNLSQLYNSSYGFGNRLLSEFQGTSKVYLFYAFLISKLSIPQLLPFITCFIIYGLSVKRINSVGKRINASSFAIAIAFCTLIATLDFRSVSGIRNMLAYAIFAFIVYADLVEKKNIVWCFVIYFLLCQIHMTIAIFLVLRIVIFITNRFINRLLIIAALIAFTARDFLLSFLSRYAGIEFIRIFIYKSSRYTLRYGEGLAEYGYRRVFSYLIFLLTVLLIYAICKKYNTLDESMDKYNMFFVLIVAMTIGSISQYDLFVRNCMLISFMAIPYVVRYFNAAVVPPTIVRGINGKNGSRYIIAFFGIVFGILYMALFNIYAFYLPMDGHFLFGI